VSVLGGGESPFRDDDGSADPRAAAALAAFGAGLGGEHAALSALAGSRLLVPVVAVRSESEGPGSAEDHPEAGPGRAAGGDHGSEMSLPTLVGRDGRSAIPVFTCVDALARWDAQARPVPAQAALVWRAAVDGSCAVVVDVAGPVPLAVDGARLAALAGGRPVPLPHQDPDVLAVVRAAAAGQPAIAGLRVTGGGPDPAAGAPVGAQPAGVPPAEDSAGDLQIELTLAAGGAGAAGEEAARLLGHTLMEQLGGRLRRGVTIAVTQPVTPGREP
jgi:SseB protein N-terminal domain